MFSAGRKFQFQQFALHNSTSRQRITGTTFRPIRRSTSRDKERAAIQRYKSTITHWHIQLSLTVHDYLIHIIIATGGRFCVDLQLKQIITFLRSRPPSSIKPVSNIPYFYREVWTGKAWET